MLVQNHEEAATVSVDQCHVLIKHTAFFSYLHFNERVLHFWGGYIFQAFVVYVHISASTLPQSKQELLYFLHAPTLNLLLDRLFIQAILTACPSKL